MLGCLSIEDFDKALGFETQPKPVKPRKGIRIQRNVNNITEEDKIRIKLRKKGITDHRIIKEILDTINYLDNEEMNNLDLSSEANVTYYNSKVIDL